MKINTEINDNFQAEINAEIENDQLEKAKRKAAKLISKRIKIPGFRKGKAPYGIVVRNVGEKTILDDAIELIIDEIYPEVIKEAAIEPYGPGKLDKIESIDPPIFKFVVPLAPEVDLGDYKSLRKPYKSPRVTKKEINETINNLRENQAIIQPVERPAEVNDIVTVNLTAIKHQGENNDNDKVIIDNDSIPFTLHNDEQKKSDDKDEWPFNGFTKDLLGLKEGDKKEIVHEYGDDSPYGDLKNSKVTFKLVVESVKERILPKLDDDFATTFSYSDVDTLKNEIKKSLKQQKLDEYNRKYDDEILEKAISQAEFKYPPEAVEDEITNVLDGLKNRLQSDNLDLDLYMKTRGITYDDLLEETRPVAEEQLKRSLFLFRLAKEENIQIDNEELQNVTQNTVNYLAQSLNKKDLRKLKDKNVINNIIGNIEMDLLVKKATERLRDIFSGKFDSDETDVVTNADQKELINKDDDKKNTKKGNKVNTSEKRAEPSSGKKKITKKKTTKKTNKKIKVIKDDKIDENEETNQLNNNDDANKEVD